MPCRAAAPPPLLQALQNWWLSVWSEATAASEATPVDPAAAAAAVDTTWYMMLYFAFGMTSLIFQVGACWLACCMLLYIHPLAD
jgi:hypothetical protein